MRQAGIDIMGRAIYNAFAEYKNKYDKGITVPFKTMSEQLPEPTAEPAKAPKTRTTDSTPDNVAQQKQDDNVIFQPSTNEPRPTPRKQVERKPERVQNNAPIDNSRPVFKIQILVSMNEQERLNALTAPLLTWYDIHKRVLPWRGIRDPYRSELLSSL